MNDLTKYELTRLVYQLEQDKKRAQIAIEIAAGNLTSICTQLRAAKERLEKTNERPERTPVPFVLSTRMR